MSEKSLLIIGAGVAGLSAGCYGQMNGYRTQIFEQHALPGGLCTSWKRQDYVFDGCVRWLLGTQPDSALYRVWEELGVFPGRPIVNHDEYLRIEGPAGKTFIAYTNIDRLAAHMRELAPADAPAIDAFSGLLRQFALIRLSPDRWRGLMSVGAALTALPDVLAFRRAMRRAGDVTVQQFAARFRDPFVRQAFRMLFDPPDYPCPDSPLALATRLPLPALDRGDAGYPIGGSLEMARAMERRYLALGGQIHYRCRVEKILVARDRAVGVRLTDGSEVYGDIILSAADGYATIFRLLGGQHADDEIRRCYRELPIFQPLVKISLGVARDFSREPHALYFPVDPPALLAGRPRDWLGLRHYCYDPTMAPTGKSALAVWLGSDFSYWLGLCKDSRRYEEEKQRTADAVIDLLEQRFPGLRHDIEVVDVATPVTFHRYTGNWQGSPQGWAYTPQTMRILLGRGMRKTLPGLENFYMLGQWVEPGGGLPAAALSGRHGIQLLCRRDRRSFVAVRS